MASWWNHSSKFHKFTFLCFLLVHPWNPKWKVHFFVLYGNLRQAFPYETIFWWSSWLKYPINYCIYKLKCEMGILYSNPLYYFAILAQSWTVTSWHHCKRIRESALWNLWFRSVLDSNWEIIYTSCLRFTGKLSCIKMPSQKWPRTSLSFELRKISE